jgi:hypothetical protein
MNLPPALDDNPYVRDLLGQPKALRDTIGELSLTPALDALVFSRAKTAATLRKLSRHLSALYAVLFR